MRYSSNCFGTQVCNRYVHVILYIADGSRGCILAYLPPYSPDLTPIEESYSTCELGQFSTCRFTTYPLIVKAFIRRHGWTIRNEDDAIAALLEAYGSITADKCYAWFKHAGYIIE
jgi:hypothetical protein